jgi:hypothetical protein
LSEVRCLKLGVGSTREKGTRMTRILADCHGSFTSLTHIDQERIFTASLFADGWQRKYDVYLREGQERHPAEAKQIQRMARRRRHGAGTPK